MDAKKLLDNLSSHLKSVIARAIAVAGSEEALAVSPSHLLLALCNEQGSIAADLLKKAGIESDHILRAMPLPKGKTGPVGTNPTKTLPPLDEHAKKSLEKAMLVAVEREHTYVGTEHLLFGLIHTEDAGLEHVLTAVKLDHEALEEQLDLIFDGTTRFPTAQELPEMMEELHERMHEEPPKPPAPTDDKRPINTKPRPQKKNVTALELFTINLTEKGAKKRIDPVIGREKEIDRMINILCRRTKNNPVLVGEPGVGKTAIAEGLARRIAEGEAPAILRRKKILALDLPLLLAGTIYRGEFEARLKQIIDEILEDQDVILFIDEIHNLIGAGSNGNGAMDAANILKPALARGLLHCIGATTSDEYSKYIEHDPALERRFQSIEVREPTQDETIEILSGVRRYYEQYHHVQITDDAVRAAVSLSSRYIHDHYLPDKAIDLIDEAAAMIRAHQPLPKELEKFHALKDELAALKVEKNDAVMNERFDKADNIKKKLDKLDRKLTTFEKDIETMKKPSKKRVTEKDIAAVLGQKLNLPTDILLANDWEQVRTLPDRLKQHIVGQDTVIDGVVSHIRRSLLRGRDGKRPLASLLFAGPSGSGKTALGKALAQELYHDEHALIKFDMSEFAESHSVSRLLGSPAGYVGHDDRNRFTSEIKKRPYSVVLFDEFDKAHPDVRRLLLQILDEGELTDSHGKKIPFHHAVIVLTTNLGADAYKTGSFGFGVAGDDAARALLLTQEKLKDELGNSIISRVGHLALFSPLTKEHLADIIRRRFDVLAEALATQGRPKLTADTAAIMALATREWNPDLGARHVERAIDDTVYRLLEEILTKKTIKKAYRLTHTENTFALS